MRACGECIWRGVAHVPREMAGPSRESWACAVPEAAAEDEEAWAARDGGGRWKWAVPCSHELHPPFSLSRLRPPSLSRLSRWSAIPSASLTRKKTSTV